MYPLLIFLKDHRRRPIWLGPRPLFRDPQADIPERWCPSCGAELFAPVCPHCHEKKGERL